jgi:hypothetical protein
LSNGARAAQIVVHRDLTLCSVSGETGTLPTNRFTLLHSQLLAYWDQKRGKARALRRADIDPTDFARALPQVLLWAPEDGGDYTCRLCGNGVEEKLGTTLKGVSLSAIRCTLIEEARREFDSVRDHVKPAFAERTMGWAQQPNMFYRHLLLPLLGPGNEVERLLSVLTFHRLGEASAPRL